jgi:hypothetical protein
MTEAEFVRARLRLTLPALQQKFEVARELQYAAQCEQEFLRLDGISDKAAEHFADIPKLFAKIIDSILNRKPLKKSAPNSTVLRLRECVT